MISRDHRAIEDAEAYPEEPEHLYFFYACCPKCAKAFGRNQVVLFAKVA